MEINNVSENETILLNRWRHGDESALKSLIGRYEKSVFSLALYLAACDRDTAYSITVSSFVEASRSADSLQEEEPFLPKLVRSVIRQCRNTPASASFDLTDFNPLPSHKRELLRVVKEALLSLSFENRNLLLLRDQLNLSYKDISFIAEISAKDAKLKTVQARASLADKVTEILDRSRDGHELR